MKWLHSPTNSHLLIYNAPIGASFKNMPHIFFFCIFLFIRQLDCNLILHQTLCANIWPYCLHNISVKCHCIKLKIQMAAKGDAGSCSRLYSRYIFIYFFRLPFALGVGLKRSVRYLIYNGIGLAWGAVYLRCNARFVGPIRVIRRFRPRHAKPVVPTAKLISLYSYSFNVI